MTAAQAREKIKEYAIKKQKQQLEKIYQKIELGTECGFNRTFISEFMILPEHKKILEDDGYFINTAYTSGFEIRWVEKNLEEFLRIVERNKESGYLNIDDDVIQKYIKTAFN